MRTVILLLAVSWALALPAQQQTMAEVLAGKSVPKTLTLGALDAGWMQFRAEIKSGDPLQMVMQIAGMTGKVVSPTLLTYVTRGQTLTAGGDTFLLAYHLPMPPLDLKKLQGDEDPFAQPELTDDTALTLVLINLRAGSVLHDFATFNRRQFLAGGAMDTATARTVSRERLQALTEVMLQYVDDHEKILPPVENWATAIESKQSLLVQPLTGDSYVYNTRLAGQPLDAITNPGHTIMLYEANPQPDGYRLIAYLEGLVVEVNAEEFEAKMTPALLNAQELQLSRTLSTLDGAIARFKEDMGTPPKTLRDLVAATAGQLTNRYKNPKAYHGPYLPRHGGIPMSNAPGIPANPLVKPDTPGYAVPATHWNYDPTLGIIQSRITGRTADGKSMLDDL